MKKLIYVSLGMLMVSLLSYVVLTFTLGSMVRAGVNNFGPRLTGTRVELDAAHISPLTGSGTLAGLTVGNPPGWNSPNAFYLGQIHIDLQPLSVIGGNVVINELIIDRPEFVYETKFTSSNIKELLDGIEAPGGAAGKAASDQAGKAIKFTVKKIRITNGKATLGVGPTAVSLPLPPISIDDLGVKEGGIPPDKFANAIVRQVLANVAQASTQAFGKVGAAAAAGAADAAKDATKKAGEGLKKIFGGGKP